MCNGSWRFRQERQENWTGERDCPPNRFLTVGSAQKKCALVPGSSEARLSDAQSQTTRGTGGLTKPRSGDSNCVLFAFVQLRQLVIPIGATSSLWLRVFCESDFFSTPSGTRGFIRLFGFQKQRGKPAAAGSLSLMSVDQ